MEESEPIAQPEEDENAIAEKLKKDKIAARLKEYHEQVKKYYDPREDCDLKKGMLQIDVRNPEFSFEFAKEF